MQRENIKKAIDECLFRHYGVEGELARLPGHDLNYLVSTGKGERYVLKIVDSQDAEELADMECRLLEHARNAGFPLELPYIIKNYSQKIVTGIELRKNCLYHARLLGFVDGVILENYSDISTELLKSIGKCLAMLDRAIVDFDHPAASREHSWDLVRAGQHRDQVERISDASHRRLVAWAFDLWEEVQGDLAALPHQVIHGDANKENILAQGDRVTGLVDFGDSCYNPRICELAICLAYLMMDRDDPMAAAASVIAAYVEEIELYEEELAVLFPLVCGRLAASICIATSRLEARADNPNWFTSLEPAIALLEKLHGIGLGRPRTT